jgi:hypothetical protein
MPENKYAFQYGRIALSHLHYEQWRRAYRFIDIDAEMTNLEPWAASQANWFVALSNALANRNRRAKREHERAQMNWNGYDGVL